MAMDWLKGLVAPTAQFIPPGQPYSQGLAAAPPPAAAPGWSPTAPQPQGPPMGGAPAWSPATAQPGLPTAAPFSGQPTGAQGFAPPLADAARFAALEARCDSLQRDLESVALFARTLLTLLQDRQLVTPEQFLDTKNKLDMLDGKLDDRIAPGR